MTNNKILIKIKNKIIYLKILNKYIDNLFNILIPELGILILKLFMIFVVVVSKKIKHKK